MLRSDFKVDMGVCCSRFHFICAESAVISVLLLIPLLSALRKVDIIIIIIIMVIFKCYFSGELIALS